MAQCCTTPEHPLGPCPWAIMDEAARAFDAWREEHDPLHELDIEAAAEAFARHQQQS